MTLNTASSTGSRPRLPAKEGLPPVAGLRKLEQGERVSHWVKIHLSHFEVWNNQGWRWAQIASALDSHLDRRITRNKLTGMVTMIRKGKLANKIHS
jgi:hypothetical protein